MKEYIVYIIFYLAIINIISICLTVKDKLAAKAKRHRTKESTLMLVGLFGGALSMYITMKIIRHKTRHMKFMIGLPIEILIHIIIVIILDNLT